MFIEEQPDFIRCLLQKNSPCLEGCECHGIEQSHYEMRQPDWQDKLRASGMPETMIQETLRRLENDPPDLGRIVRFYGLTLTDCKRYFQEQLSNIDPELH